MAVWQNPLQSRDEQRRRIHKLIEESDDAGEVHVLNLMLEDDEGRFHVESDGRLFATAHKMQQN